MKAYFINLARLAFIGILFLCTNNYSQNVLWSEDWEGAWSDDWHADAGTWVAGTPTSGPNSAYQGHKSAATVLDGNYAEPVDSRLIRHISFTVPSANENPRLRFWHWYSFSTYDYGQVQIKVENGSWEPISPQFTNTGSAVWTSPLINLSAYAGSAVQIAFYFHSHRTYEYRSSGNVSSGWYIDDIAFIKGSIQFNDFENFESGIGDWCIDRGTWEIGEPTGGPSSAFSISNCAATVLAGNYYEPVDSRLISPPMTVPPVNKNPALRFRHWYSFSTYDYGNVQIKTPNSDWTTISNDYTNTSSNVWTFPYFDLSTYADSVIQIAFYFHSNRTYEYRSSGNISTGWYIDDVLMSGYESAIDENQNQKICNYRLDQNYPNPFNPLTNICYSIPKAGYVTIEVYNMTGQKITTLLNKFKEAGTHTVNFNGRNLSSGVYFYSIRSGSFAQVRKMILVQ